MINIYKYIFTPEMDVKTLIESLIAIYDDNDDDYIIILYRKLSSYSKEISNHITNINLIDKWNIELDCLKYESLYGDGDEYSDLVINDCLKVLKEIIDELLKIE